MKNHIRLLEGNTLMTLYATHRFSVGQLVSCPGKFPSTCKVIAQIAGRDGPEYEIASSDGRLHKVVAERELTYRTA
jgi:hypothetical protein